MTWKSISLVFLVALMPNILLLTPVTAQVSSGTISGRATDSAGAVLQGAQVELQPQVPPTVTNGRGEFTISAVAPGGYEVTVSYVGFSPFSTHVTVAAGQVARFEAVLNVATKSEQVMVYAGRAQGEAEAINRERTSDNILQVLPLEVITSLPNTNIADALGRLPSVTLERDEGEGKYVQIRGLEPRLSNVTINGVNVPSPESGVRQIKLDVIPANLVESVEINKTLSANQDGDAIGGSVNLVTKTADERPTLYLNGIGGYTPIESGRSLTELDGTVGKRFGANKRLGVLFGGSYDWNGRGIDDIEPSVDVFNNQPVVPSVDLREYAYYRSRYGFTGSLDYKLGDVTGLYLRGVYSHFNNFGDRWVYSPSINTFVTPTRGDVDGSVSFNAQIRRPVEVIGSLEAGGKHVFTKWWLSYDLSVSRSSSEDHGYATANFDGPSGDATNPLVFALDRENPYRPKLSPQNFNIYDPALYSLSTEDGIEISKTYSPQLNLQGAFSAARNYNWGGHFGSFEFGAKVRNAHKFQDANDRLWNANDSSALMSNFVGSATNPDYYDKSYTFGPTVDYGKVRSFFNNNPGFFTLDPVATAQNTSPNNFDLIERVSAGYLMNTLQFGRFRLQTGVRFEATNENLRGNQVIFDAVTGLPDSIVPIPRNASYLDVLPSVQVRYELTHDSAIRAAYGRGIARPDYGDLPPSFSVDLSKQRVGVGNPDLKPTHANNYDLLFEQDLKPLGLLQAGFFYKQLSDPIYSVDSIIPASTPPGPYDGFTQTRPVNGTNAHLYGFEIAYQQHLRFLPGLASGLGISANYSYTNSRVDRVPLRTDSPPLQRQAPNSWNVSPTYDRGRFSVRAGISHNDANIFQYNYFNVNPDGSPNLVPLGKNGPLGDVYLYAHTQVDAQGTFRMYRGLQLVVSALNLTNEVFGFYQGSPQFPIQREYYKPSYSFGLRYTLSNESK